MKQIFIASFILLIATGTHAQFGNLLNKAKNKVKDRVDGKVDKSMDKALDNMEGKKASTEPTKPNEESTATDAVPSKETGLKSYSKFDFIAGEKVLYAEDFAQDAIGELPLTWNSNGKGEVMTIEGKQGKWLRAYQGNTLLSGNKSKFGENYTVEFDAIYYFEPKVKGYVMPNLRFGLLSSGTKDNQDNTFLRDKEEFSSVQFAVHVYGNSTGTVNSYLKRSETFRSDRVEMPDFMNRLNKVIHYSIQVQKTRFRLWMDGTKLFDIPRAINVGDTMNQLYFNMESSNYKDDEIGYYINNIKIATGLPDTRHKLIEEGKFSTTGILFDFQSAVIKPESYGVIKEIATVLKENPTVKVKVIGHTSNDGDAAANLELSKQRAAAVKQVMIKEFGIDEQSLQTEGKGGTQPVADNKTKEGKTQNRRVEFIKL